MDAVISGYPVKGHKRSPRASHWLGVMIVLILAIATPAVFASTVAASQSCSIASSGLLLAHGNVAPTALVNHTATSSATITCTASGLVTIRAVASAVNPVSNVPVRPDGSITSRLEVAGYIGEHGAVVDVVANQPKTVPFYSTLASASPTPGALQGNAILSVDALATKPISITGNVVSPLAPKAVMRIVKITDNTTSNLAIRWSWSTTPADYGSALVPANYFVGFFIRNSASSKWFAFRVDGVAPNAASWTTRIQAFHDKNPQGSAEEPASRVFEPGTWCVTTGAASTRETGGIFIEAPGATESCITI